MVDENQEIDVRSINSISNGKNKSVFTPFLSLHGFDKAHQAGFRGEGQTIIFFEGDGVDPQHPIFEKTEKIERYDVGRGSKICGVDKSDFRYLQEEYQSFLTNIDSSPNMQHGNHVIGIAVGQPISLEKKGNSTLDKKDDKYFAFSGGAIPNGQAINISYSQVGFQNYIWYPVEGFNGIGRACYGVSDAFNNPNWHRQSYVCYPKVQEKFEEIQDTLIRERLKKPADDSLLDAFKLAGDLDGVAINISATLASLCDPLNNFLIPEKFLNQISATLEKNDKILILSANNCSKNLSTFDKQPYFKQFAVHPKISPRFLIAVNVITSVEPPFVQLPNGTITGVERFNSSNYPGEDLKGYAVSAFGSNILSGWSSNGSNLFEGQSGTSQSAPQVASLCTLWKQKCPKLSGPEIVKKIKETAILLPDEANFGIGLINAWALASDQGDELNKKPIKSSQNYSPNPFSDQLIIAMLKQHPHLITYTSTEIRKLLEKAEKTAVEALLRDNQTRQVLLDQSNIVDSSGETILHHLARAGRADMIKVWLKDDQTCEMLLNKNVKNRQGSTPLHIAAETGKADVIKIFLENEYVRNILFRQENVLDSLGKTPFYLAIFSGFHASKDNFDVIKAFLKIPDAQPIQKLTSDLPLLHWATLHLQGPKIIKCLLENDETRQIFLSPENIKDKNGRTVLHALVNRNKKEVVKSILENPASITILLSKENIGNKEQANKLKEKLSEWSFLTDKIESVLKEY